MPSQIELRQQITNEIVAALESGSLPPWRKPWRSDPNAGFPCNVASNRPYSGVNPLLLEIAAQRHNLQSRFWATFRQWEALGGRVKRRPEHVAPGQWGTSIVFCKRVAKPQTDKDAEDAEDTFFVLRSYTVFNVDQVDGPFDHLRVGHAPLAAGDVEQRCAYADAVIAATGADIRYGGDRAFYNRLGDFIQIPRRDQFAMPEFYETTFHELTHWTEHPNRLNWGRANEGYAMGELVAELGACYVAGELGLPSSENLTNHAAYLKHWLAGMKGDARFIFKAAAQASKAVDYVLAFSRQHQPEPEPVLA